MPTSIENTNSGVFSQVSNNDVSVTTRDTDSDGLVDGVKILDANAKVDANSTDGWMDVSTNAGLANVNQLLQSMGFEITNTASFGEIVAKLGGDASNGAIEVQAQAIVSGVSSALVLQTDSTNNYADLQGRWAEFMEGLDVKGEVDVNSLIQWVLRQAYIENTKDLQFFAQKVSLFNDLKDKIRSELTHARKALADTAGLDDTAPVSYSNGTGSANGLTFDSTPVWDDAAGKFVAAEGVANESIGTKAELDAYIQGLEEKLNSVGDDAQLANVDLQNMLQKQQQTLQMMSNISKMLHDTAMAVIRKIGS